MLYPDQSSVNARGDDDDGATASRTELKEPSRAICPLTAEQQTSFSSSHKSRPCFSTSLICIIRSLKAIAVASEPMQYCFKMCKCAQNMNYAVWHFMLAIFLMDN